MTVPQVPQLLPTQGLGLNRASMIHIKLLLGKMGEATEATLEKGNMVKCIIAQVIRREESSFERTQL